MTICTKIVGHPLKKPYESSNHHNMVKLTKKISSNSYYALNYDYRSLPSGRSYRVSLFEKFETEKCPCTSIGSET